VPTYKYIYTYLYICDTMVTELFFFANDVFVEFLVYSTYSGFIFHYTVPVHSVILSWEPTIIHTYSTHLLSTKVDCTLRRRSGEMDFNESGIMDRSLIWRGTKISADFAHSLSRERPFSDRISYMTYCSVHTSVIADFFSLILIFPISLTNRLKAFLMAL
jgi:hypothetical protein